MKSEKRRSSAGKKISGRLTGNNKELEARRLKEYKMWISGITKMEIARQSNLTWNVINNDIKYIASLEPIENVKEKIDAQFNDLFKLCREKLEDIKVTDTSRIGYIREASEILTRLARIHGLDKGDNYTFNSSITNIVTGIKVYDKWDNDRLQEEFKRRRIKEGIAQ
jgi:hypothetical protein